MTAYFDKFRSMVHDVVVDTTHDIAAYVTDPMERLFALDVQCVRDVSICAEWPGLPAWAREAIHTAVINHSWSANSELTEHGSTDPGPDDVEAYRGRLDEMERRLHATFHSIGEWARAQPEQVPFSDDPLHPMDVHLGNAKDAQLALARKLGRCLSREELRAKRITNGWDPAEA